MRDDLILQFPSNTAEMLVPANSRLIVVDRVINRQLRYLTVSIPDLCTMEVLNDNLTALFFTGESGTLQLFNGLYLGNTQVILTNTTDEAARFNYRLIFE